MPTFEAPFVNNDGSSASTHTTQQTQVRRPATSARRGVSTPDTFGAGVIDPTQNETTPCSIYDGVDNKTIPIARLW